MHMPAARQKQQPKAPSRDNNNNNNNCVVLLLVKHQGSRCHAVPEYVGDLQARGREVEHLHPVATVPRLSEGVAPAGLGQLLVPEEEISRPQLRVRHTNRLVVVIQLQGVRCTNSIGRETLLVWSKQITALLPYLD